VAPKPSRLLYAGFSAAAAALLLFGYLANEVLRGETLRFDNSVRNIVHSWASPTLTYVMRGVTQLGAPRFLIVLSLVLVLWLVNMGRKRAAILLVVAAAGAVALDELLKLVFHRPRPEAYFGYPLPSSYSFPSGHAVSSCCFYGVLAAIVTARMRSRAAKIAVWTAAALMAAAIGSRATTTSMISLSRSITTAPRASPAAAAPYSCTWRARISGRPQDAYR